jgi:hypothetical protein
LQPLFSLFAGGREKEEEKEPRNKKKEKKVSPPLANSNTRLFFYETV